MTPDLAQGDAPEARDSPCRSRLAHELKIRHTSTLYRRLGVRNRAEAVQKAQRLGFIS